MRESRRKPQPVEQASDDGSDPAAALQALRQRVAELSSENEALRKQVANLLQQLVA